MVNGLLNTLVALLMGGATLSFTFTATDPVGNVVVENDGEIITCGENYRMETQQVLVVSDGSVMGIYQKGVDEIILQPVTAGGDIMTNPFALLKEGTSTDYKISTQGKDAKGLPKKVILQAKNGALYTIDILGYSAMPAPSAALFTINTEDYPTATITDLR